MPRRMRHDPSEHRYPNAAILIFPFDGLNGYHFGLQISPPTPNHRPHKLAQPLPKSLTFLKFPNSVTSKFSISCTNDGQQKLVCCTSGGVQSNVSLIHVWSAFVTTRDVSVISKSTTQFSS
ncbi:hypothetical protein MTP99_001203 [Tenebrio molitor]|nr:hypothetical protein MTP99_001203 [Tenebrio molitor]